MNAETDMVFNRYFIRAITQEDIDAYCRDSVVCLLSGDIFQMAHECPTQILFSTNLNSRRRQY